MKLEWIGLKFTTPLLIPLTVDKNMDEKKERHKWKKEEHATPYCTKGFSTRLVGYKGREICAVQYGTLAHRD